jgi:cytochrome c oxidase subunit II
MAFVVSIVFLVIVSVVFHFWSPWWLTDIASNWSSIDDTILITFWVTGFVFVIVNAFLAYCVYKYRYDKNRRAAYEPENHKLEIWLTGITAIGVASMLAPGLLVWADFVTVPEDAHEVEVVGQQWQWSYRYPGADGIMGTADTSYITASNPLGVNPDDPFGQDDIIVETKEMHLPINEPVHLLLRSKDVLHDYTVAQFRVKMDMVPGSVTFMWLEPTVAGRYDILCEEHCGLGHFVMRGTVVVEEREAYDAWLATQDTFAQTQSVFAGNAQAGQGTYAVCAACHGQSGEGNLALNAPKIAGQEDWYIRQQIEYYKLGARGTHPDDIYGAQMAPMAAILVNDQAVNNVTAYIDTLPDVTAPETVTGDLANGADLYQGKCSICHGKSGQGLWGTHAPRLSGMTDWYLVRQLQNFKQGVRGTHPEDQLGYQMTHMVSALADDEAINDVVAYINTLQ